MGKLVFNERQVGNGFCLAAAPCVYCARYGSYSSAVQVAGVNGVISWPLQSDKVTQLSQSYKKGIISATELEFQDPLYDNEDLSVMMDIINRDMVPEGDFRVEFSHLMVESQELNPSWLPQQCPVGCFATLMLFLPSSTTGEKCLLKYKEYMQQVTPKDFTCLAFYNSITIEREPIVQGYRSALVYHVIYNYPVHCRRDTPPQRTPLCKMLPTQAMKTKQAVTMLAIECKGHYTTHDTLIDPDNALAQALVTSKLFDVALVTASMHTQDNELVIQKVNLFPLCGTPDIVSAAIIGKPLLDFINGSPLSREGEPTVPLEYIVMWPKRHRIRFLGFQQAMKVLRNWKLYQEYAGYTSLSELSTATMDMLNSDCNRLHYGTDTPDVAAFASFLLDLDDFTLIATFMSDYLLLRRHGNEFQALVFWTQKILMRYGWEKLWLPTRSFLKRHGDDIETLDLAFELLRSIALGDSLQPTLRQPFIVEYYVRSLALLTWAIPELPQTPSFDCDEGNIFYNGLLIEQAIAMSIGDTFIGSFFARRLPGSLIVHINSFLYPTTLRDAVNSQPEIFQPGSAIARGMCSYLSICPTTRGVQDYLGDIWKAPRMNLRSVDMVAILCLAHGTPHFDVILQDMLAQEDSRVIDGVHELCKKSKEWIMDISNVLHDSVLAAINRLLHLPPDTGRFPFERQYTLQASYIFEYLNRPGSLGLLQDWVLWRFQQLEAPLAFVWCVVVPLYDKLQDIEMQLPLARAAVTVLEHHVQTIKLPAKTNWTLNTIKLNGDCQQCQPVQVFLNDPNQGYKKLKSNEQCIHLIDYLWERHKGLSMRTDSQGCMILIKKCGEAYQAFEEMKDALARLQATLSTSEPPPKRRRPSSAMPIQF
ncbi:hypothetical protein THRCLA_11305 [Thraustotheca clavata]|uniref:Uncharacterized protein n=1 Tax=Thraustotheca clavata TaxID=74557 RepID=A0A1V9Y847_9STRA|nr:hypothetical protein THRCLA_11305 [Thraustotheca clavata]